MPQPKYDNLSDEELIAANQTLMAKRTEIGEEQDRIAAVLNARATERKIAAALEQFSDAERDVLVQAVAANVNSGATAPGSEG